MLANDAAVENAVVGAGGIRERLAPSPQPEAPKGRSNAEHGA